jgi:hypothetical protein
MTSKFDNAFSLVVPGITDSGWLVRDQRGEHARSSHLLQWGISTRGMSLSFLADDISLTSHLPQNYAIASQMASASCDWAPSTSTSRL